ncbi:uncharacterized protein PpBr36_09171 [Pyricularia pennisetigena]|uniref:uncharacterized protein n=1 Tax=Pyricularia pennisetigena TaxID=1578925 RepID=UPI00115367DF|nr:uncharacterized protein PpBr36_09171 [Pyricularia pennisetigena]TLS22034.1 hypothetical protein PpBr36_09171 [Pyricularia pennisetigena]
MTTAQRLLLQLHWRPKLPAQLNTRAPHALYGISDFMLLNKAIIAQPVPSQISGGPPPRSWGSWSWRPGSQVA